MDQKIKNWLGIAAIAALVAVGFASLRYSGVYAHTAAPVSTFASTGEGKVTAVPDVAEFTFGITTEGGKDVSALQKENSDKANAAIAYVKSSGVDAKDIQTESYDISPRYQYYSCTNSSACKPSEIIGYTVSQTILVKVRDFAKTGDLLSGVADKGANNISGLSFTMDDMDKVRNEAVAKAIQNAESKAKDLASAGHFRLGRIVSIQESSSSPIPYYRNAVGMGAGAPEKSVTAPSIEPGSNETVVSVTVTYEIL